MFSELSHEEVVNSVFGESEESGSEERTGVEGEVKVCGGQAERRSSKQEGRIMDTSRRKGTGIQAHTSGGLLQAWIFFSSFPTGTIYFFE